MNNAFQELFCDFYNYFFVVPTFFQPSSSNLTSVSDFLYFPECFSTTPREKGLTSWNKLFYSAVGFRRIYRGKKDSKHIGALFFFISVESVGRLHQSTKCLIAALKAGLLRQKKHHSLVNNGFLPVYSLLLI